MSSIEDNLSLTASVKFPIIPAEETAGFFTLDATGSLGINFNLSAQPSTQGGSYSPQTLGAALAILGATAFGEIATLGKAISMGDEEAQAGIIAADIAINVAETFAAFINGATEGLDMSGTIGFPVMGTGIVGKFQIPFLPIISAEINGGINTSFNWGIGNTDNSIALTFPIGFGVKVGPIGVGFNFNPGWTWDVFDGNKNSSSSSISSEVQSSASLAQTTSGTTASFAGSLITVDFGTNLKELPSPSDFSVTMTDINGNPTNIPVFNVVGGSSSNLVVVQLESVIPTSENFDYSNSDNPTPTSNNVSLSFTNNEGITDTNGNSIEPFTIDNITNNTPNSIAYQYNPTSGNSQNYINPTLLLAFNTPLDTNVNPDLDRFSVTSNNTALSITNAQVTSNGVLLTLDSSVTNQSLQNVSISYNDSSSLGNNPLKDSNGGSIESFTIQNGISTQVSQSFVGIANNNSNVTLSNTVTDYSVTVTNSDGTTVNNVIVQSVSLTGENAVLTLSNNVSPDQTVSIFYQNQNITNSLVTGITPPAVSTQALMANIEADLGQDSTPVIISGGSSPLLAWVADVPPLEAIAGFVNGKIITLNFIDELGNGTDAPNTNQFTVTDSDNNSYTVGNVSVSGNSLTLTLNTAVTADTELNISYNLSTPTANHTNLFLKNSFTNTTLWINEFSDFALTNTIANTNPPVILGAGAIVENTTSNQITLVFDQNLINQGVTNSDFIVESNGQVFSIEPNITINANNTVILSVQPPEGANLIGNGDIVTVSYTGDSLSSSNGNVANFTNQTVITSPSTPTTVIKYALLNSNDTNLVSNISSIPGTGGFNFNPVGAYDSTNNITVLVWSNANSSDINTNLVSGEFYTDDNASLINESFNQSDVYYSIYNPSSKTWSLASSIAQQQGSEGKIVIGEWINNQLMTAWINYNNGESTIYWSSLTYNNGVATWSTPAILYADANPDPLTELSIVTIDGKPTVLWTETQATSYSQLTQEESPLLYYRLAETSGTTLVNEGIYGAGGNGTYSGSITFNEVGALENTTTNQGDANPAVFFNSGNSATSSTIPLSGTSFSLEFWFKVPSLPSNTLNLVSANGLISITLNNSGLSLSINNIPLNSDGFTPTANQWHYVVATFNGESNTANLYVNNQNVGSLDNVDLTIPSSTSLTLAGSSNGSVYLDEVAFYRQALTYNDTPNISDFANLTPSQITQLLFNTSQISNKYNSQYIAPLPPGPNTNYVTYENGQWGIPSTIDPTYKPIATQLSDANKVQWDVTSYTTANSSGYVNPNGNPDIFLSLNLGNQVTGNKISSIEVTANNITWSVGNTNGYQLAVVQGDKLLNPVNPNGSFNYTILSPNVDLDLFLDAGSNSFPTGTTFNVTINYSNGSTTTQTLQAGDVTSEPTSINFNQVLGIATVTEANDSSLALIDSGFIINTNNPSIGYSIISADFNNDGKSDVAVGNRGYTNTSGTVSGQGTIQILFGGGAVLSNSETNPLTANDLSGNPNGVLITGLSDTGQANGDFPFSMATGDVNGDGYEDLVIGDPNANQVYVIYGSNNLAGKTINVTNLGSQGYVINAPTSNIGFGYSVAVGNFNSNAQSTGTYASGTKFDIAIGAPGANNGNGAVYVAFDGSSTLSTIYNSQQDGELAGYSLAVSSRTAKAITFTGNKNSDDLIIGAIGYQGTVTNKWNGLSGLPSSANNNPNGQSYPSTSIAEIGAVYVYQSNSTETLTEYVSYTGSNLPSSNGTANNGNLGSALNSSDLDGDGINDLAISAPGDANNKGAIYVLKGGISKNTTPQNITSVANLGIVGGLSFSQTGAIITSPGDVNNDGYADFLITAPQGANGTGQGYVLFGPLNLSDIGTIFDLNVTANDSKKTFLLNGDQPYQLVGSGASGIGDVNGDGVDDLMISATNAGQLYTIFGHPWLADDGSIKLADISANNGFVIDGDLYQGSSNQTLTGNGNNVVMLGDVNGDGFADVLSGGSEKGGVLIFGNSTKNLVDAAVGTDDIVITVSNQTVNKFVALGDINGDGLQDLGVIDNNNNFYVQLGSPSLSPTGSTISLSTVAKTSIVNALGVGDYNGDGYDDLLLTSSNGGQSLYLGNSLGALSRSETFNGGSNSVFNGIGDVNGDGFSDIGGGSPTSNQVSPFYPIANGQGTVYLGNSGANSNSGIPLLPPTAGVSAPLQTDSLSWFTKTNFNPPQSTKFNGAPSLAVYNDYLYMGYTGVSNSSNNGSPFVQRSADGFNWEGLTNFQNSIGQASTGFTLEVFKDTLYAAYVNTSGELIITYATPSSNALGLQFSSSQNYYTNQYVSYVSPALAVFKDNLYVFYATGNEYSSSFGYYSSSDGKTWTHVNSIAITNGFLPLGASFAVTTDENNLYLSYATGTGSSTSNSLTFATFNGSSWKSSPIEQKPLRGSGLLSVSDTLYNFYLPSSGDVNVITSTDQGSNWSEPSLLQDVSNQYWLTYPNPVYYQENIYLGYGIQSSENGNVQVAYGISNPIYQSNQTQQFGQQLENIGDFNGDGIDDFAVLAPGFFSNVSIWNWNNNLLENNKGAVLIYYGSTDGFNSESTPDVVLGTPAPTSASNVANNQALLLTQMASAGDINGDGYDDLIIASPSTALNSENTKDGEVFVVFGGKNWGNTYSAKNAFDLNSLSNNQSNANTNNSNQNGFLITGLPASQAGISLAGGEDVNGDGFSDFIIGAPGDNDNLSYVIFGSDFNKTVTQTGTIGNDVMIGTATGESFIGGEGNDQIYTNGGIDVVYAGTGDDFVTVNDTYFRRLDGGAGTDVLRFEGYNGQDWNLTTLSPGSRLRNFEILVTEGYGANTLTLNSLTVTQLSPTNTITVVMDKNDTLNLSADFSLNGTVHQYNQKFDRYTSNTSSATVLLNRIVETGTTNLITVTKNASSTNSPTSNLTSEVASVNAEIMTSFSTDESGNETAQSFASSVFSATQSDPNAPTRLSVSNPTANEADGEVSFTIQRTGDLDKYVQVHYITQDGRGKAGSHYQSVLGRTVFKPGETTKTVSVPLILDDVYTGTRDLGLLVTLEEESHTLLDDEFHLYIDSTNGQIRNWNHIKGEKPNSVMGGELEFRVTTTDGKAQMKLYFEGNSDFNNYYIFNNDTQKFEGFKGARFFDETGDGKYEGAILNFQDGSKYDVDGAENGIFLQRGFFADGEAPEIILDTAMYRFRSLQTEGAYLYVGAEEKESVLANYSNNFVKEGLAFYVSQTENDDLVAFNRFRNTDLMGGYIYAGEAESEA
ncbi:Calx-beta domain-containing protein, partial [Geminocystis sp. CENA526]|uniref:Calx-beta domain-containing protein n=1 Tax=Geminocystis sp. CENA526 TaxID=1355871 RepID=UPI003D6EFF2D